MMWTTASVDTTVSKPAIGYFLGVILPVAAVGLFEWKCKSENKTLIRTAMLVGLSLISTAVVFWMAFVLILCLVEIAPVLAG